MTDSEFGRAFTSMLILLVIMTFGLALLGNYMASEVDAELKAEREVDIQKVVADRIEPFGEILIGDAASFNVAEPTGDVILAGDEVYTSSCAACHGSGVNGAPKFGDAGAWSTRLSKGLDALYNSAINGLGGTMPARGGNSSLNDGSVQAAVDYILDNSK